MQRTETKRASSRLAIAVALLLATACGGGDNGPTGPGDGGGIAGTYDLVALGFAGLPLDLQIEDCGMTRFHGGKLQLNRDGSWQLGLQVEDYSGAWGYQDQGELDQDGTTLWFDSEVSGSSYQAAYDGSEFRINYDWCYDGTTDVQLVFGR